MPQKKKAEVNRVGRTKKNCVDVMVEVILLLLLFLFFLCLMSNTGIKAAPERSLAKPHAGVWAANGGDSWDDI